MRKTKGVNMVKLETFINEWNSNNKDIKFELVGMDPERPMGIEVRFSAARHRRYSPDIYKKMIKTVELWSHHTLFIITSYRMFIRGIISFKVASCNPNCKTAYIISALKRTAEIIAEMKVG